MFLFIDMALSSLFISNNPISIHMSAFEFKFLGRLLQEARLPERRLSKDGPSQHLGGSEVGTEHFFSAISYFSVSHIPCKW